MAQIRRMEGSCSPNRIMGGINFIYYPGKRMSPAKAKQKSPTTCILGFRTGLAPDPTGHHTRLYGTPSSQPGPAFGQRIHADLCRSPAPASLPKTQDNFPIIRLTTLIETKEFAFNCIQRNKCQVLGLPQGNTKPII